MNMLDIQHLVIQAVAGVLKKEVEDIDEQRTFVDLGADELDLFELILKIEDEFMLEISDDDVQQLTSVAQVVSYVAARKLP
jgi:acyl carrier protein